MTFEIGDMVEYKVIGTDDYLRILVVTNIRENIKNGLPGFDGYIHCERRGEHHSYWGYTKDITRVWRKA